MRDIEIINTELMLADLESVQKRRERLGRDIKKGDKTAVAEDAVLAWIESDLVDLAPDEAEAFLKELGVEESGMGALIRSTYHLLGLMTYFTAGEKEVRAWTIHAGEKGLYRVEGKDYIVADGDVLHFKFAV